MENLTKSIFHDYGELNKLYFPDYPDPFMDFPSESNILSYNETLESERIIAITVPVIFAFVVLIGFVGNVLVILVVAKNHQMQNSTNTLIINLAFADLLFIVFCVPFTAADYALPIWVFSWNFCKIMQYLQNVTAYASVWTLVLMSLDR